MLIRTMQEFESQGRIVSISHGKSTAIRLLTKADGLSFSISEARAEKAGQAALWYKHHWEANYVRAGRASLEESHDGPAVHARARGALLRRPEGQAQHHSG